MLHRIFYLIFPDWMNEESDITISLFTVLIGFGHGVRSLGLSTLLRLLVHVLK